MSNLLDRYLLFRIRTKRDPEAFAKIYDRHVEALYRFAFLKLPSREEAQDITSETFARAWDYLLKHDEVAHVRGLLYRIARNLIADFYRSPSRSTVSVESVEVVTLEVGSPSTPTTANLQDAGREKEIIEARAELALILGKLERLKEDYRDVVTLRLIDDLSFDEIAAILEKTTGNVRVIFHRALKALKEHDQTH